MRKLTNLDCFHSAKIIFLLFRVSARRSRWPGDKTSAGRQSVSNRLWCIDWGITMYFRWCILYYKENSLLSLLRSVLFTGWEVCSKIGRGVSDKCGDRKKIWNVHHNSEVETHVVGFPEWLQGHINKLHRYWLQPSYMFQLQPVTIFREPHHLKIYTLDILYSIKFTLTRFSVYSIPKWGSFVSLKWWLPPSVFFTTIQDTGNATFLT